MQYPNNSPVVCTLPRHCEERFNVIETTKSVEDVFVMNERRGNLPSLIFWREFFMACSKITFLQSQSREIASRVQQRFTLFAFLLPLWRLAMTTENGGV
jgi:hypothetical protein